MSFFLYIMTAAWQDGKNRSVSGWLLLFFFTHFLTSQICRYMGLADWTWQPAAVWFRGMELQQAPWFLFAGCLIGAVLLFVSRVTEGAVGAGDGLFFLVSGVYLGFWRNLFLFGSALALCSLAGLCILVWGQMKGKDYRKKKLPFLIFTIPAGILLVYM